MFEAIQFLQRLRDYFADHDPMISIGVREGLFCVIITFSANGVTMMFDFDDDIMESNITNEVMEQMLIQRFENEYKMWEVGEI